MRGGVEPIDGVRFVLGREPVGIRAEEVFESLAKFRIQRDYHGAQFAHVYIPQILVFDAQDIFVAALVVADASAGIGTAIRNDEEHLVEMRCIYFSELKDELAEMYGIRVAQTLSE